MSMKNNYVNQHHVCSTNDSPRYDNNLRLTSDERKHILTEFTIYHNLLVGIKNLADVFGCDRHSENTFLLIILDGLLTYVNSNYWSLMFF